MALYGTLGENDIAELSASIADTAVDVFVYDTSKDSDGGAWRNRTQHTSWYNETLNTATRGSRKEFPAVAVLVLEGTKLTIYDGDDPDLPMWMVFPSNGYLTWASSSTPILSSIHMLNGIFVTGASDGRSGLYTDFIKDDIRYLYNVQYYNPTDRTIKGRNIVVNGLSAYSAGGDGFVIVANQINDVAMTVLPNAPVDSATGLPVPTIAVATNSGISIIKDDGHVISSTSNSSYPIYEISILPSGELYHRQGSGSNEGVCFNYPYTRIEGINLGTYANSSTFWYATDGIGNSSNYLGNKSVSPNAIITPDYKSLNIGDNKGLTFVDVNKESLNHGMSAFTASNYSTGWMHGDIKGAFLSDTDTTDVTGSELVTNGTFDTNTNGWFTGGANNTITRNGSGQAEVYRGGGSNVAGTLISMTAGVTYVITANIIQNGATINNAAVIRLGYNTTGYDTSVPGFGDGVTGIVCTTYTPTTDVQSLWIYAYPGYTTIIDDISIRIAEEDRSVNNKGLAVYGTITKSAVATGADLVAYSGFSASNHLAQPYNSDLNPGSGSYSVVAWFKTESNNSGNGVITGLGNADSDEVMLIYVTSGYGIYFDYGGGSEYVYLSNSGDRSIVRNGNWHQVVCQVTAGQIGEIYIDGIKKSTSQNVAAPNTWSQWDTNYRLYIGCGRGLGNLPFSGSISLVRYSLSKISTEQIKKMYEDEKVLFQENAKCTLYGSSDAVTALAYDDDTNLLHVGTSSGRSDFQGLRRINNTTEAVTTAISASNGLVAEQ